MSTSSKNYETLALHGGSYRADPTTGSVAVPLYQTTSYQFQDTAHAARLFALQELGNIYTRLQNPTQDAFEQRVAALEGGVAALAVASGQTASTFAILNVAQAGDNIVSSTDLYGGTVTLFAQTLKQFGIEVRFVDPKIQRIFARPQTIKLELTMLRPCPIRNCTSFPLAKSQLLAVRWAFH